LGINTVVLYCIIVLIDLNTTPPGTKKAVQDLLGPQAPSPNDGVLFRGN